MPAYRVDDGAGLRDTVTALQRQTVLWFATVAERAAQLPNPRRGLLSFIDATGAFEWWNGTAWQALAGDTSALAGRVATLETKVASLESRMAAVEARPAAPTWWGGVSAATVFGNEGTVTVTHNLGVVPQAIVAVAQYQVLGGGAITDVLVLESKTATTFTGRMATNHGDFLANGLGVAIWWLAMAP